MGSAEKKEREEKLGCRSRPKPGFLGGPEAVCFVRLLPKTAAPDLTPTLIKDLKIIDLKSNRFKKLNIYRMLL